MGTQFLLLLSARSGLVLRQLHEIVRAPVAQGGAGDRRGLCAQQWFGWAQ